MSIGRLLHEFRPLFRMLEEPITRPSTFYSARSPQRIWNSFVDDSGFLQRLASEPAIDLKESDNAYIVEADLPGVSKSDVDVQVGEGGRSLVIRGSVKRSSENPTVESSSPSASENIEKTPAPLEGMVQKSKPTHQTLTSERSFVENTTFTRTIWFPQPVDASQMKARLKDGVLTVNAEKLVQENATKRVTVE
ncbi:HSP20-like chaperone [Flagelloscypha sp. PMI_526]|nr:HSP20-like chaperone [Flagelloscypha sp. PMI_526]